MLMSVIKRDVRTCGIVLFTLVFAIVMFIKCNNFGACLEKFDPAELMEIVGTGLQSDAAYKTVYEKPVISDEYKNSGTEKKEEPVFPTREQTEKEEPKKSGVLSQIGDVLLTILGIAFEVLT